MNRYISAAFIGIAVCLVVLVLAWSVGHRRSRVVESPVAEHPIARATVPPSTPSSSPISRSPVPVRTRPGKTPPIDSKVRPPLASSTPAPQRLSAVLLRARLRCPSGTAPGVCGADTQARVGLGAIDSRDLADRSRDTNRAPTAADLQELINIREWRFTNVFESGGGELTVGPTELPPADAYDVLAWNVNHGVYYYHRVLQNRDTLTSTAVVDVGPLDPQPYTGVRVHIKGEADFSSCRAVLERVVSAEPERASQFLNLVQVMAPELAQSLLTGEPVNLVLDQPTVIAPLPPDEGMRITLVTPTDVEGTPVEVALVEGKIVDVDIDLNQVFPEGATASIDLDGGLELGDTGRPIAGARVLREVANGRVEEYVTDSDGLFHVSSLPIDRVTSFEVQTTSTPGSRPIVPTRWNFDFAPPLVTTGTTVQYTWKVPSYKYLIAELTDSKVKDLIASAQPPYPVYLVEKMESGNWQSVATDFFDINENSVAASIEAPGQYRMVVAVSPIATWFSQPARIQEKDSEVKTRLDVTMQSMQELKILVRDAETGEPVPKAVVMIGGPVGSFPPLRLLTNDAGELKVPYANTAQIMVWVTKAGYEATQRTLSPGDLASKIEIPLRRTSRK